MPRTIRLGILTPSSNTALEPLTHQILSSLPTTTTTTTTATPTVTAHFSRFPVTSISLSTPSLSQFTPAPILAAARLLADAHVDVIGWSGTSSGWLGFASDEALCAAITAATGVPATTSVLALNRALAVLGVRRLGLLTPYMHDVQAAIVGNYMGIGIDVGESEVHLGIGVNTDIVEVGEERLDRGIEEVVGKGKGSEEGRVQAVTTFCTNLRAAQRVVVWEERFGVPVLDTVTTVVWDMLRVCGVDYRPLAGKWGRIFEI